VGSIPARTSMRLGPHAPSIHPEDENGARRRDWLGAVEAMTDCRVDSIDRLHHPDKGAKQHRLQHRLCSVRLCQRAMSNPR